MLQVLKLFKLCGNLPAGHCSAGLQAVIVVSKATCWALCCRGAGCLSSVSTYLLGTVLQVCIMFKRCQNLLLGTVFQGCRLFKLCQNLPGGHYVAGMQAV